jgi:hypothetical protein
MKKNVEIRLEDILPRIKAGWQRIAWLTLAEKLRNRHRGFVEHIKASQTELTLLTLNCRPVGPQGRKKLSQHNFRLYDERRQRWPLSNRFLTLASGQ